MRTYYYPYFLIILIGLFSYNCSPSINNIEETIISYEIDPKNKDLKFYWKNESGISKH